MKPTPALLAKISHHIKTATTPAMQLSNITERLNLVERSFLDDLIRGYSDDSEAPRNPDKWTHEEWRGFAEFLRVPSGFTDEDEETCQRFADMIDGRP